MAVIDRIVRAGVIVAGIVLVGGCAANSQSHDRGVSDVLCKSSAHQ